MLGNRPGSRPAEPEQPEKSGGGLQQQLALTMAQALTEMAAGMRYLVAFGRRMQENKRNKVWRLRTSTLPLVYTFDTDIPVQFWTVHLIAFTGSGLVSIAPGGDAPDLTYTDGFYELPTAVGILSATRQWVTIETPDQRITVRGGTGLTLMDVLVVAHNGTYRIQ